MKKFSYQATDINGKIIRGQEMAEDYQDLQQKLKERNLYITRYRDLGANDAVDVKYKFKTKEVSFISRQLASMTSAGLSLVRALYILQEQQTNKKAKRVLLDIYEEVQKVNPSRRSLSRSRAFSRICSSAWSQPVNPPVRLTRSS